MKTKFISPNRWLVAPSLAIAAACVLFAQPVLAQTRAALVQSVDEPGRNPYQEHKSTGSCSGSTQCNLFFAPVPAGKRLVLTHINGTVDVTNGTLPTVSVVATFSISPVPATATAPMLAFTGVRGAINSQSGTRIFINHTAQAYFVSGELPTVQYALNGTGDTINGFASMMLTGYLVNVP